MKNGTYRKAADGGTEYVPPTRQRLAMIVRQCAERLEASCQMESGQEADGFVQQDVIAIVDTLGEFGFEATTTGPTGVEMEAYPWNGKVERDD